MKVASLCSLEKLFAESVVPEKAALLGSSVAALAVEAARSVLVYPPVRLLEAKLEVELQLFVGSVVELVLAAVVGLEKAFELATPAEKGADQLVEVAPPCRLVVAEAVVAGVAMILGLVE